MWKLVRRSSVPKSRRRRRRDNLETRLPVSASFPRTLHALLAFLHKPVFLFYSNIVAEGTYVCSDVVRGSIQQGRNSKTIPAAKLAHETVQHESYEI
jgi:hypothetical protein